MSSPAFRPFADELTVRLLRDRYRALETLRHEHGDGDWFPARMLGRPALVVRGEAGVRTFYDSTLVTRRGAVPAPLRLELFGPGAVHGLAGEAHQARKAMFLDIVDRDSAARLSSRVERELEQAVPAWLHQQPLRLFDELVEAYGLAVLDWAGTGVRGLEGRALSHQLAEMVDGFGVGGTAYPKAVASRARTQLWAHRLVAQTRSGRHRPPEDSPLARIAGTPPQQLPDRVAATELLNLVRPTVAVAWFGAWAAQALTFFPEWCEHLAGGSSRHLRAFDHELRRIYPFVPLLTGRLVRPFEWEGRSFPRKGWMVLDVLGTNHDPRLWDQPEEFRPERFLDREPTAYDYVPQGGGDPADGHRCPGEPLAVGVVEATVRQLARLHFRLDADDLAVPLDRIPSLPRGRMTLRDVRRVA